MPSSVSVTHGGCVRPIRGTTAASIGSAAKAMYRAVAIPLVEQLPRSKIQKSVPLGASSLSSSMFSEKPARTCAGFSFGDSTNDLRLVDQVIGLRRNRVIQRLSERLPHSPAITSAASSYRAHPGWRFVATAHLSIDQVNYWNKYSDTLVRYSRYICVTRRDNYSLYSAVYQLRVCRFMSR